MQTFTCENEDVYIEFFFVNFLSYDKNIDYWVKTPCQLPGNVTPLSMTFWEERKAIVFALRSADDREITVVSLDLTS